MIKYLKPGNATYKIKTYLSNSFHVDFSSSQFFPSKVNLAGFLGFQTKSTPKSLCTTIHLNSSFFILAVVINQAWGCLARRRGPAGVPAPGS